MSFDLGRFRLWRITDSSGVSGKGWVAEGVRFSDGTAAMRWLTNVATTAVAASIDHFNYIHGHGGHTRIAWIDNREFSVGDEVLVCDPRGKVAGYVGTVGHIDYSTSHCSVVPSGSETLRRIAFEELFRLEPVLTEPPTL